MPLTNVVGKMNPFQETYMFEEEIKPLPLTVKVKPNPPVVALEGEMEVIAGCGLLIANASGVAVPPPGEGLNTEARADPAVAMSLAGIAAVS